MYKSNSPIRNLIATTLKIVIFIGNIGIWDIGIHAASFVVITGHIISPVIVRECIRKIQKRLQLSHNICKESAVYRQLQVFNSISNAVQQSCLGLSIVVMILCTSMAFGLLIASSVTGATQQVLVAAFLILTVDGTIGILVALGGLVRVHSESKNLITVVKRLDYTYMSQVDRRWVKRFWQSCDRLRIKFGDSNFLEDLTPLRCYDCVLDYTVQILLLSVVK